MIHDGSDCIQVDETTTQTTYVCLDTNELFLGFPIVGKVDRTKALNIARWLRPTQNGRQTVIMKSAPSKLIQQLGANNYGNQWFVNSVKLNRFLKTKFLFKTQSKLEFPLTRYIIEWIKAGVDVKRIVLLLLLTEGGGKKYRNIFFYNRNQLYHELLVDCIWQLTEELPTSYMIPSKYITKTGEIRNTPDTEYWHKKIVQLVFELSPSLKCKPALLQTKTAYQSEAQPNGEYLLKGTKLEKELMALLIIGTEGYITPFNNQNGFCSANIGFRCSHPTLLLQFIRIFRDINIHMTLIKDKKSFSKLGGAHNSSYDTGKKILELIRRHGDLLGTIHGNSIFHEGVKKSKLLIASLDFYIKQKSGALNRSISRKQLHELLNQRIESQALMPIQEILKHLDQNPRIHRNIRSQ